MNFKEWAISSGKLNEKVAVTYWSGLTNTRFKEDGIAVADVTSIDELTERIGKDTIDTQDIEKLLINLVIVLIRILNLLFKNTLIT